MSRVTTTSRREGKRSPSLGIPRARTSARPIPRLGGERSRPTAARSIIRGHTSLGMWP
ncbi:hypothetical protein ASPFODRAFT_53516 [Aspergillus luchuensis CBS 106.47]|uniref:Uncharacterized protein n=1 Tax=Aspergillus luchuensis (strain CBS 106.47) TaxID=1137211 RepID=A0A1M3T0U0_ASPLC|nr:hypothetical protein ASPFODRAFT_53516 [Aspergillus luchuensis CBS 106.47]